MNSCFKPACFSGMSLVLYNYRSATEVLMSRAREKVLPMQVTRSGGLKATERLYNDLLDYLRLLGNGVGWSRDDVETTGKRFVLSLRDTLWYLDGQLPPFGR